MTQRFNQTDKKLCQITDEKALASSINKNEHILQLLKQAYINLFSDNVLLKHIPNIVGTSWKIHYKSFKQKINNISSLQEDFHD